MKFPGLDKAELEEMFARVDGNGDRRITFAEFEKLVRGIDPARPQASLATGFAAIDRDRDGEISFEEFRDWVGQ